MGGSGLSLLAAHTYSDSQRDRRDITVTLHTGFLINEN